MKNSDILLRIANGVYEANTNEREALAAGARALDSDPLDIAYLSMGALQALDADNGKAGAWLNEVAGNPQTETISVMLSACLPAIQRVWAELDGYEGVWAYDVVEPLGMWFINEWFRREVAPTEADAKAQARKWADE